MPEGEEITDEKDEALWEAVYSFQVLYNADLADDDEMRLPADGIIGEATFNAIKDY